MKWLIAIQSNGEGDEKEEGNEIKDNDHSILYYSFSDLPKVYVQRWHVYNSIVCMHEVEARSLFIAFHLEINNYSPPRFLICLNLIEFASMEPCRHSVSSPDEIEERTSRAAPNGHSNRRRVSTNQTVVNSGLYMNLEVSGSSMVDIWEEGKVFGSRGQNLKDEMLGKHPPPSISNGRNSNPIKIVKRDSHPLRIDSFLKKLLPSSQAKAKSSAAIFHQMENCSQMLEDGLMLVVFNIQLKLF